MHGRVNEDSDEASSETQTTYRTIDDDGCLPLAWVLNEHFVSTGACDLTYSYSQYTKRSFVSRGGTSSSSVFRRVGVSREAQIYFDIVVGIHNDLILARSWQDRGEAPLQVILEP